MEKIVKNNKCNLECIQKAIEVVGGASALAKKIDVTYQTVIFWKNGKYMPNALNCSKIEKATEGKVKRQDILPDYPWDDLK